jgi:hypothetical protein
MKGMIPVIIETEPETSETSSSAKRVWGVKRLPTEAVALDRALAQADRIALPFLRQRYDPLSYQDRCRICSIHELKVLERLLKRGDQHVDLVGREGSLLQEEVNGHDTRFPARNLRYAHDRDRDNIYLFPQREK